MAFVQSPPTSHALPSAHFGALRAAAVDVGLVAVLHAVRRRRVEARRGGRASTVGADARSDSRSRPCSPSPRSCRSGSASRPPRVGLARARAGREAREQEAGDDGDRGERNGTVTRQSREVQAHRGGASARSLPTRGREVDRVSSTSRATTRVRANIGADSNVSHDRGRASRDAVATLGRRTAVDRSSPRVRVVDRAVSAAECREKSRSSASGSRGGDSSRAPHDGAVALIGPRLPARSYGFTA